jgi:phage major head subunit gpT-like protein
MYNSASYADLLEPGLRKVFADVFYQEQQQSIASILFNVSESRKAQEHDLEMGDVADFSPFTGTVSYDDTGEGYKTNYVHQEFTKGMKVERKLVDDDLYNVIARKPQQLGLAAFRKRETDAASVFNNAFVTNITGGDGLCLCSTAHTSNNGGSSQSNAGATALSPTEVETARIKMVKYQSNRNNPLSIQPDMLIVPVDLESYAYEIINSRGKVDTAQNNVNFHVGRYKLVVWPNYLTSSTRWFMVDSRIMKMYLNWFDRITPQFYKDTDFDTLLAKFAGYMRYSYGWSDWRFVYGENA